MTPRLEVRSVNRGNHKIGDAQTLPESKMENHALAQRHT
jgi:hypothetical protein